MVTTVYLEPRSLNGLSASNREELYVTKKHQVNNRHQPLRTTKVVKGIVTEGMTSIQRGFQTFCKLKGNHCTPFLLGVNRQWNCYVGRSTAPQRLRGKTSDTLYTSAPNSDSFSAGY
ncbi:hypothetical protein TNCV_2593011 [Trichonephila clavipes]|nr:hypothetical protein TNCV_2593011 [Trichonephila clavipes]